MIASLILVQLVATLAYGHNVSAVGKNVSASTITEANPPERAVDGDTRGTWEYAFTTNFGESSAWFSVDLEEEVISPDVTIYFKTDYAFRKNGVRISLSNVAVGTTDFCHTVTGAADGSDIADVYSFVCGSSGRYLYISSVTDNDGHGVILDLPEVQVHACSKYTFGENCESECHCVDEPCDWRLENPVCSLGCMPGWKSSSCDALISSSDMTSFQACYTAVTFTFVSLPQLTLTEMEVLSGETRVGCIQKCSSLILCMAAELSNSSCTLWRTGSSGPSQARDMWKKKP